jgi:DNA-binding Lrp family transcriptional regulator
MDQQEQILAALKKLGPSAPRVIADTTGLDPSVCSYHLLALLKAKALKAAGTSNDRVYALHEQKLQSTPSAPPQKRKAPAKRRKAAKSAQPRATARPSAFLPAMTADLSLVLVNGTAAPQIFNPEQTQAIADLLLNHFEA